MSLKKIIETNCAQYVDVAGTGRDSEISFPHTYDQLCTLLLDKGYSALITQKGNLVLYYQNQDYLH
jgi:hypothetical protein